MFNYYARTYSTRPKDFDNMHNQLFTIGLRGYIAFTKDMQIPIDKARAVEVWKKSCVNHQPHEYEDFKASLTKLAMGSNKFKVD